MAVPKFIWLVFDDLIDSYENIETIYIPYNCQFYVIKNQSNGQNHKIVEIYHRSPKNRLFTLNPHIGMWSENTGLQIFEYDFYKRRINLNGTILIATYKVSRRKSTMVNHRRHTFAKRLIQISVQNEGVLTRSFMSRDHFS